MIQITVAGKLGKDAKTKSVNNETVLEFSVASTAKRKGQSLTTWIDCQMWGKRGEALAQYLTKGSQVAVVGSLSTREFEHNGAKRISLECRVNDVELQSSAMAKEERPINMSSAEAERLENGRGIRMSAPSQVQLSRVDFDDEIPF